VEVAEFGIRKGVDALFVFVHQKAEGFFLPVEAFMDDISIFSSHGFAPVTRNRSVFDANKELFLKGRGLERSKIPIYRGETFGFPFNKELHQKLCGFFRKTRFLIYSHDFAPINSRAGRLPVLITNSLL
jgi:hypothetical protein